MLWGLAPKFVGTPAAHEQPVGPFGSNLAVFPPPPEREFPALLMFWAYQQNQLFLEEVSLFFARNREGGEMGVFPRLLGLFLCFLGVFCAFWAFLFFSCQRGIFWVFPPLSKAYHTETGIPALSTAGLLAGLSEERKHSGNGTF